MEIEPTSMPGTPASLRLINRSVLLERLRKQPASRAELARATGISAPTVSSIVRSLIEEGFVIPAGPGESIGGRRPEMMQFNPRVRTVMAFDATPPQLSAAVLDLNGSILLRESGLPIEHDPHGLALQLAAIVKEFGESKLCAESPLAAVGVAVPGTIDPLTEEVYDAPALGWERVHFGTFLKEVLPVPVVMENDFKAAALAELRFGHACESEDFVLIGINDFIGAGVVLGGKLHHGYANAAGEVGYLMSLFDQGKSGPETGFRSGGEQGNFLASIREALDRGDEPDPQLIQRLVTGMAAIISSAGALINPRRVFIGGALPERLPHLIDEVSTAVSDLQMFHMPTVERASHGRDGALLGVGALALDHVWSQLLKLA